MKYYKNTEIAALFHVSEKAARNWVEATQQGKLNLELFEKDGRFLIANTSKNMQVMEDLVSERKKFKNTRSHRVVSPKPEFYNLYNEKQILDIISSLDVNREAPLQYSYFNGGADHWTEYTQKLLNEKTPNSVTNTVHLLGLSESYILDLSKDFDCVNVVDLGVGDGNPVRQLLTLLMDNDLLDRYIGIDLSQDMLDYAAHNIREWFDGSVNFEGYIRDLTYERFNDLLIGKPCRHGKKPLNLVLFLGGTISNLRLPGHTLQVIASSMGREDVMIHSQKIDTASTRRYFDLNAESGLKTLNPQIGLLPDLLGVEPSLYDIEQFFDEGMSARTIQIRLKKAISIDFQVEGRKILVEFDKSDAIVVWRAAHKNSQEIADQFDANGFDLMQTSKNKSRDYLLTISKVKV